MDEFADEEVLSIYGYLSGYKKPKSLQEQVRKLRELFPELGERDFIQFERLYRKEFSCGAEGLFAIPQWKMLGKSYCKAFTRVVSVFEKTYCGRFENWCEGRFGSDQLRQSVKSRIAWKKIGAEQRSNILIVAAQFGIRHRGRSIRRAREVMGREEFGLGAFAVGIMLLTHENRLQHHDDLWIDCAGDECHDPQRSLTSFDHAPNFVFSNQQLNFTTRSINNASGYNSSASGWYVPSCMSF